MFTAKFWGVRGSIPAPISPLAVEEKVKQALSGLKLHQSNTSYSLFDVTDVTAENHLASMPFWQRAT